MLPSGGQGAVNALQDAVILANCLYDLESKSPNHITEAFKSYKEQRYPHAKYQMDKSRAMGKISYGQVCKRLAQCHPKPLVYRHENHTT
jgi:2-polyprenyl-6-methoxyphenol hydroxylase-like FAD-dependent oxidoreductase